MKRAWRDVSKLYNEALSPNLQHLKKGAFRHEISDLHPYDESRIQRSGLEKANRKRKSVYDLLFLHTFQMKTSSILSGRRIALLEHGDYAVVPVAAQSGDAISIFTDAADAGETGIEWHSPAFVVRPCGGSRLEGYVKDIMVWMLPLLWQNPHLHEKDFGHYILVGKCSVQEVAYDALRRLHYILILH